MFSEETVKSDRVRFRKNLSEFLIDVDRTRGKKLQICPSYALA